MDDAIRLVEFREVALDFVADRALSMLFVEVTLMPPRRTCFFGLDQCLEVSLDEERCPGAIAEFAEGDFTPLGLLGDHEDLTAALHPKTILLMQVD